MDKTYRKLRYPHFKDLTGKTFHWWTVLKEAKRSRFGAIQWLCKCRCGKEGTITGGSLRSGDSKSCGCWKRGKYENDGGWIVISCKMCGKLRRAKIDPRQGSPKYCSYPCMYADKEALRAKAVISTAIRRTPESRAKTSAANRVRYQDPEQRRKTGEISHKVQAGWEWKEVLCVCGCGGTVRYKARTPRRKWSKNPRPSVPRFLHGHNTKTEEFRKWQSERVKKEMEDPARASQKRRDLYEGMERQLVPQYFSRPMQTVKDILTEMSIEFEGEWETGRWSCDFYLPTIHGVIEVQGDYWHCNPRIYPDGPINKSQRNRQRTDISKASYLENRGIRLLTIWEYDLKHTPSECQNRIEQFMHDESLSSK